MDIDNDVSQAISNHIEPQIFPEITTVRIDKRPVRRNPLITSILYYSKDVESFGTGLKRIADACKDAECRYEFKILKSGFVVVFYRNEEVKDSKGATTGQDTVQVAGQVTVQELLDFCSVPRSRQEMQE